MRSLRVVVSLLQTILTEISPLGIYSENKFYEQKSHIALVFMKEISVQNHTIRAFYISTDGHSKASTGLPSAMTKAVPERLFVFFRHVITIHVQTSSLQ